MIDATIELALAVPIEQDISLIFSIVSPEIWSVVQWFATETVFFDRL
jgi:hypothetical protein